VWVCNLVCHVKTITYKEDVREYSVKEEGGRKRRLEKRVQ